MTMYKEIIKSKRFIYLTFVIFLVLFSLALNIAFSAFTNRSENKISNIKVAGMEYNLTINGSAGTTIISTKNNTTKTNISITSLNNIDSKYELIYHICSDVTCTNFINKPEGLNIEYSSRTIDTISGAIETGGNKNIRIITTNNTNDTYYIKLDINAGYIHNTLALQNLITTEYNEEDIIIAATIDGEISTTFPSIQGDYETTVTCTTNDGPSNATGTAAWDGSKWVLNVSGVDSGRTICNVEFFEEYKLATDSDFQFVLDQSFAPNTYSGGKGSYRYTGNKKYIIIPEIINGEVLKDYHKMFAYNNTIRGVKLSNLNVTNMQYMFWQCSSPYLDLQFLNTSYITNMNSMFFGSEVLNLDLSSFDTTNVTNMSSMFRQNKSLFINLSSFNTTNVTNMNSMFQSTILETIDISNFNTSNVTTMDYLFANTQIKTIDLSNFDTSNVKRMSSMFYDSMVENVNVTSFDTSKVTHMNQMFRYTKINTLDLSSFDTSSVTSSNYMLSKPITTVYARTQNDIDFYLLIMNDPNVDYILK